MITIVTGPRGCGKTTNKEKLKTYFGAKKIVDGWWYGQNLEDGDLALTNWVPNGAESVDSLPGQIYSWDDLKRKKIV